MNVDKVFGKATCPLTPMLPRYNKRSVEYIVTLCGNWKY